MDKLEHKPNETQNSTELSTNVTASEGLTIADAMTGPSLARVIREHGRPIAIKFVNREIDRANRLCGSSMDSETISYCAEMIIDRFKFRTVNALRIAIRDGLNSGKIYGKLTYPIIAEWLIDHEEKIEAMNYSKHLSNK